jgi:diguanylate cyclase (GGDEF)-like protein
VPQSPVATRVQITLALLLLSLVAVAATVVGTTLAERAAIDEARVQARGADDMLAGMLDRDGALRLHGASREEIVRLIKGGDEKLDVALDRASASARDRELGGLVREQITLENRMDGLIEEELREREDSGHRHSEEEEEERAGVMSSFRDANSRYAAALDRRFDERLDRMDRLGTLLVVLLTLVSGVLAYMLIVRRARAEQARLAEDVEYRGSQAEFTHALQATRREQEAHEVLKVHLEQSVRDSSVVVLNRNTSANRLEATTDVPRDSPLHEGLIDARPDSCLAVRLGRAHERDGARPGLLRCEVCGKSEERVTCVPPLVGGEVIGSVLVSVPREADARERKQILESVSLAAPVLANQRNLEIAELRAATDALTGLLNSRAAQANLKEMLAQAAQTHAPLGALVLDLDHFKQINDRLGHATGDDVLVAAAEAIGSAIRRGDVVGRVGGEEFLILLPATDEQGAMTVAEHVRLAIAAISLPRVDRAVTASLGVAVFPRDGLDADSLFRAADRALYAAKGNGRDRVEVATTSDEPGPARPLAAA